MHTLVYYFQLLLHVIFRTQQGLGALLLLWILGFVLAIYLKWSGFHLPPWITLKVVIALFSLMVFIIWQTHTLNGKRLALALMSLCVGLGVGWLRFEPVEIPHYLRGQFLRLSGQLEPHEKGIVFHTTQLDTPHAVRLLIKPQDDLPPVGEKLCLAGVLQAGHPPRFEGDFDEARYLQSMGVVGVLNYAHLSPECPSETSNPYPAVQSFTETLTTPWRAVMPFILKQREKFVAFLKNRLGEEAGSLMGGIVLGDRASPLPKDLHKAFVATGQVHLIAASGMNVAIIAGMLLLIFRLIPRCPRWMAFGVSSVGVLIYGVATGFPPSILRAVVMWFIGLWVKYWFKPLTPLFLLLLAVSGIGFIQPFLWLNLGFQLSVLTTFGIVTLFTSIENHLKRTGWDAKRNILAGLLSAGLLTGVAQLYATPLILFTFFKTPLHAILMNLVSGILVAPLTLWGFLGFLLFQISPLLTAWFLALSRYLLEWIVAWTQWGASFPSLQWHCLQLPWIWVVGVYAFLLALPWFGWIRPSALVMRRLLYTLAGLLILLLFGFPFYWEATRFDRLPEQQWVSLHIKESLTRSGVSVLHYKGLNHQDDKNSNKTDSQKDSPQTIHSIVFTDALLNAHDVRDLKRYFTARHLPPPEELVFLEATAFKHLKPKTSESASKKTAPKTARQNATKKKARKTREEKRLSQKRLLSLLKRFSAQEQESLSQASEAQWKTMMTQEHEAFRREQLLFLNALLKEPTLPTQEASILFRSDAPPAWTQIPEAPLLALKATNTRQAYASTKPTKQKIAKQKKTQDLRSKHAKKTSKSKQITPTQAQRARLKRQDFEQLLHQEWYNMPISTWTHHPHSRLNWQIQSTNHMVLELKAAHLQLNGQWHEHQTPRQRRWNLQWIPTFV